MPGDSTASTHARDAQRQATEALRNAVADLNDLVVFGELDTDERNALADRVAGLLDEVRADHDAESTAATPSAAPTLESWGDYRRRSPFAGVANPRAPGLAMRVSADGEGSAPSARGTVTVGAAFAGPPGFVHGGVIAGLIDEAIGWLAAATMPEAAVVTGKLSVRFRAPTPVDEPLELHVTVTRQTSRSMTIEVDVSTASGTTATGEALMVVRR